jgi:heme exporter protein CcmD
MNPGPYAAFILAAYLSALSIVAALIAWVTLDRRHLLRLIEDLEMRGSARGGRRREKKS